MQRDITIGLNRTGMKASPVVAGELLEALDLQESAPPPEITAADIRSGYLDEAEPVGSVPPPMSIKGVVGAATQALAGNRLHVLLDKLGERAAFERSGVRLYEAMLLKAADLDVWPEDMSLAMLQQHRDEEALHYQLLVEAIEQLGGDPTTQTPCADVTAVQGMGLLQVMGDPRTTLPQALQTLLSAELIDEASWELLIELAIGFGQEELSQRFTDALVHESRHTEHVRAWLSAALAASALGEESSGPRRAG